MRNAVEIMSVPLLACAYYYFSFAAIGVFAAFPFPSAASVKNSVTLFLLYSQLLFIASIMVGAVFFSAISAFLYKKHMLIKATAIAVPTFCAHVYHSAWLIVSSSFIYSVWILSEMALFAISIPAWASLFGKIRYNRMMLRASQAPDD